MPEPDVDRPRAGSGNPGIGESAAGILGSLLDYAHARVALFFLEAREARAAIGFRLACAAVGAFFLLIAWLALLAGGIGWLSRHQGWPWPAVTLAAAAGHLLAGLVLLAVAKRRFSEPPFRDSLRELEKDRHWLKRHRPD